MVQLTIEAFSETYDIINHMEKELYEKIPQGLIELIKQNSANNYVTNLDYTKSINDQKLLEGTKNLLAIIYRDFICSKEKKEEIIKKDLREIQKREEAKRKEYSYDNLFNKKSEQENIVKEEQKIQMIEYKEDSFIKKIINKVIDKIKTILKK